MPTTTPVIADGLHQEQESIRKIPALGIALPRISTILGFNPKGDGKALAEWRETWIKENPDIVSECESMGLDPANYFSWRGTQTHSCLEAVVQGHDLPDISSHHWVKPFAEKLQHITPMLKDPIWSEGPLPGYDWPDVDTSFKREGDDTVHHHIWSMTHGYVGTPDLVCQYTGGMQPKLTLFDLKTSKSSYSSKSPSSGGTNKGGYFRYCKAATQLAMYEIAFKELFGLEVDQWGIIVLVENRDRPQLFFINNDSAKEFFRNRAIKQIDLFYEHHPELGLPVIAE